MLPWAISVPLRETEQGRENSRSQKRERDQEASRGVCHPATFVAFWNCCWSLPACKPTAQYISRRAKQLHNVYLKACKPTAQYISGPADRPLFHSMSQPTALYLPGTLCGASALGVAGSAVTTTFRQGFKLLAAAVTSQAPCSKHECSTVSPSDPRVARSCAARSP